MALPYKVKSVPYIEDAAGVFHKVREKDGVHCTAFCRKYIRGETVHKSHFDNQLICKECIAKTSPVTARKPGEKRLAGIVIRGHQMSTVSKQAVRKGYSS